MSLASPRLREGLVVGWLWRWADDRWVCAYPCPMLKPAPTTKIDPDLARGRLEEILPASATHHALLVVSFPNTSYRLRLEPAGGVERFSEHVGKGVVGRIHARAKRVDVVGAGGRYVEPVHGRPRRVQGSILSVNEKGATITVGAGAPLVCALMDTRQKAGMFEPGQFVSFDVERGATFTLVE